MGFDDGRAEGSDDGEAVSFNDGDGVGFDDGLVDGLTAALDEVMYTENAPEQYFDWKQDCFK